MWWKTLVAPVTDIVSKVLDKFWPDKISEKEQKTIESRIRIEVIRALKYNDKVLSDVLEKVYGDRDSARQLAIQEAINIKPPAWAEILRILPRPLYALGGLVVYLASAFEYITLTKFHETAVLTIIAFYFGARTVQMVTEKVVNSLTQKKYIENSKNEL